MSKGLGGASRIAALLCLLGSAPLALLKYPWLPATIIEYSELRHDPAPWGTPSYHHDRELERRRVELALVLYALGTLSLCSLCAIVLKALPWWAELSAWAVTTLTGVGVARFESVRAGPGTDPAYVMMAIALPSAIAVIAALAAVATIGARLLRQESPAAH